jgi:hypothetical protein
MKGMLFSYILFMRRRLHFYPIILYCKSIFFLNPTIVNITGRATYFLLFKIKIVVNVSSISEKMLQFVELKKIPAMNIKFVARAVSSRYGFGYIKIGKAPSDSGSATLLTSEKNSL